MQAMFLASLDFSDFLIFVEKIFYTLHSIFTTLYFLIIFPLKGHSPSIEDAWILFTQGWVLVSLVKIGSLEKVESNVYRL